MANESKHISVLTFETEVQLIITLHITFGKNAKCLEL